MICQDINMSQQNGVLIVDCLQIIEKFCDNLLIASMWPQNCIINFDWIFSIYSMYFDT